MLRKKFVSAALLVCTLLMACLMRADAAVFTPASDGVVSVTLGQTIAREVKDVEADNCAYGPKQDVDAKTGETEVYLPYGNNPKLYSGTVLGNCSDASADHVAEFSSTGSDDRSELTYKLDFDRPISAFRFATSDYAELSLAPSCVAGVEYSVDGKSWKTLHEAPKGTRAVYNLCPPDTKADGLNTKELYVRIYARDTSDPTAAAGAEEYIKLRMAGEPHWGQGFFDNQCRIWLTEAK